MLLDQAYVPQIIFDTDMESDCDDAGALAILLNAHNRGKARLLGVIADAPGEYAAPCCEAMCRYYGVQLPIGAVKVKDYASSSRFDAYRAHCAGMSQSMFYNRVLARRVGKTDAAYESAGRVYRKMLADAQDGSVIVVCVGFLTALAELLQTEPDEISPLNGRDLMRAKVKYVVSMGDAPHGEEREVNFNYAMDRTALEIYFRLCPVPTVISPEGTQIVTGHTLSDRQPVDHPVRMAYEMWTGVPRTGRSSWDLIAVLRAMQPDAPCFTEESWGTVRYDTHSEQMCWENGLRRDVLLGLTGSSDALADELEKRMNGLE